MNKSLLFAISSMLVSTAIDFYGPSASAVSGTKRSAVHSFEAKVK